MTLPPRAYDVDPAGGRLLVNEKEAERVRTIFALFKEHGSARLPGVKTDGSWSGWSRIGGSVESSSTRND